MVTRAFGISSAGTSGDFVADYPHIMLLNEGIAAEITEVNPGDIVTSDQMASAAPHLVRSGKNGLKCVFSAEAVLDTGFRYAVPNANRDWSTPLYTFVGFMWYSPSVSDDVLELVVEDNVGDQASVSLTENWKGWRVVQYKLTELTGDERWDSIDTTHIDFVYVQLKGGCTAGTRYFDRMMVGKPYELVPVPRSDRQLIMSAAFEGKATHFQGFKKPIVDHGNNEQRIIITGEFLDSIAGEWDHLSTKEQRFDRLFDFFQYTGGITGSRRWFVLWWYGRCFDVTFHSLTCPWRSGENNIPFNLTLVETTGI